MHAADPEIKVFEYSSGGAFGELALLHGEPRLATVRCTVGSLGKLQRHAHVYIYSRSNTESCNHAFGPGT